METTQDPAARVWLPPDPKTQPRITDFFHSSPEKGGTSEQLQDGLQDEAGTTTSSADKTQPNATNPSPKKSVKEPKKTNTSTPKKRGRAKKATNMGDGKIPIVEQVPVGDIFLGEEMIVQTSLNPVEEPFVETPPSKKRRRSFTVQQKREVIEYAKKHSLYKASIEYKLSCGTIGPWMKKDFSEMESMSLRAHGSGRKLSYPQRFEPIITQWILEQRDIRPSITTQEIIDYACSLIKAECPNFRGTRGWFQKFLVRNNILNPDSEPLSKTLPPPLEEKITNFLETLKKTRAEYDYPSELIANMDEVIVNIDMASNRKTDRSKTMVFPTYTVGGETQSYTLGAEKQHITVVLTALANGTLLPPMIIFKGVKTPKHISMPSDWLVCVQDSGYLDSSLMDLWTREIWLKHTQSQKALLVMDCCHPHVTEDYTTTLSQNNTTVHQVPAGCSTKLQPVSVTLATPFKDLCKTLCAIYYQAKLSSLQNPGDRLRSASKEDICPWLVSAYTHVTKMQSEVAMSFLTTGLTLAIDGSENGLYRIDNKVEAKPIQDQPIEEKVEQEDVQEDVQEEAVVTEIVTDLAQAQGDPVVALTELDNSLSSLKTLYSYMLQMQNKALSESDMQILEEQLQTQ